MEGLDRVLLNSFTRICIITRRIIEKQLGRVSFKDTDSVFDYYEKFLHYTCTGGKMWRGVAVLLVWRTILRNHNNDTGDRKSSEIKCNCCLRQMNGVPGFNNEEGICTECEEVTLVAWTVELLQGYFLVFDDMMDDSEMRRGKPCWYRVKNIGTPNAINDGGLLHSLIHLILQGVTFTGVNQKIISLFLETELITAIGQHLDTNHELANRIYTNTLTTDWYHSIIRAKTGFYTFWLPVKIGLILAGVVKGGPSFDKDSQLEGKIETICISMGELFQIQDDYMGAFSCESQMEKTSTDIQESKFSWVFLRTIERLRKQGENSNNEASVANLTAIYKKKNKTDEEVKKIQSIFNHEELHSSYKQYCHEKRSELSNLISEVPDDTMTEIMSNILSQIAHRQK